MAGSPAGRRTGDACSVAGGGAAAENPYGLEANRRNLEVAIDYVHRQRLIPRRYAVEELFA